MANRVLIVNGPNLNMLGSREPEIYGKETLADLQALCEKTAKTLGISVDFRQSNTEGELVGWIQEAGKAHQGILINAAAYTHTSVAIMDALLSVSVPIIEVHLSNIFKREEFRHHSYVSPAAKGVICGLGAHGYVLALEAMAKLLEPR
ncbi:MAG: type II 3-dehydroquinate dehydratase [Alphaproteobacteria bacterium]|nr:type II 3-dehydroquinate dehydratase [Alphaproteobacteria bacterium]